MSNIILSSNENQLPDKKIIVAVFSIICFLVLLQLIVNTRPIAFEERRLNSTRIENPPKIPQEETIPGNQGTLTITNRTFRFDPTTIETIRPDIFNPGFFSMFDILVHLDRTGQIDLQYHFDESMNTHIIDSIDNEPNWWYQTYYSGGWPENNVFRPDHYPWKDGTTLTFYKESEERLDRIYSTWEEEIVRKTQHNQTIVIPTVEINSRTFSKVFTNVTIKSHNLRTDIFQEEIITAIDVILSLQEQNKITSELQWYESIGSAGTVKSYWVESIDKDRAYGSCGYVFEAGSTQFPFFSGNHIHLPSDTRVLNSPEYVRYFWICI